MSFKLNKNLKFRDPNTGEWVDGQTFFQKVTKKSVTDALGYTAADEAEVSRLNESIMEISGDVAELKSTLPEVFIAEYGVTSFADIRAAIDAGKHVQVNRMVNGLVYSYDYTRASTNFLYFGQVESNGTQRAMSVNSNNAWSTSNIEKTDSVTSSSTSSQYPSSKAVYDFMASPSTMPTLTESEQAAARSRIGEEWEVIMDVTLTEEVGISSLMNLPKKFRKYKAICYPNADGLCSNGYSYIDLLETFSTQSKRVMIPFANSGIKSGIGHYDVETNVVQRFFNGADHSNTGSYGGANYSVTATKDDFNLYRIYTNGSKTIPVGVRIVFMGME